MGPLIVQDEAALPGEALGKEKGDRGGNLLIDEAELQ